MSVNAQRTLTYSKRNRRKQLLYFLNYLKHANKCQRGAIKDPVTDSYRTDLCKFELCMYVDLVVSHKTIMNCKSKSCNIAACSSSSEMLSHSKDCRDLICFICRLIGGKNAIDCIPDFKNSISELKENFGNLDILCGLFSEEETVINYCSCGEPITATCSNQMSCSGFNRVHLPAGLIIERKEPILTAGIKPWHSSVTPLQRNNHISGFFRTIISKTDSSVLMDKRLFYFLVFVAMIEKNVYESSDSKGEYIKTLLEKIKEIDEEFRKHRKNEKNLIVQDAAETFFKDKIGNYELREVELPIGWIYILGEPISLPEGSTKQWQKTLNPSDREILMFKMYGSCFPSCDFNGGTLVCILAAVDAERKFFSKANSKEEYFQAIESRCKKVPDNNAESSRLVNSINQGPKPGVNKSLNVLAGLPSNASAKKKSKPRNRKYSNQSHVDRSKNVIQKLPKNKYSDSNDGEKTSDPPAFCYSHYLLLTYSVTSQLCAKQLYSRIHSRIF